MQSPSSPSALCADIVVSERGEERGACVTLGGGDPPLDLRGLGSIALPGIIDMHVHLRGLELSYKEDERSGTLAALAGCITAVVDMPNTRPHIRSLSTLERKLSAMKEAYIDYGLYAGIPEREDEIELISSAPIAGFKIYPEDMKADERILCGVAKEAERRGLLIIVHAEHPDLIATPDYGYGRELHRSCAAEMAGIYWVMELASRCGARPKIHITHVSCERSLALARALGFTTDVTPHHLLFDIHRFMPLINPYCESKVNPPLRSCSEKQGLWIRLLSGEVDAIASDHAPHSSSEKMWLHPSSCSPGFSSAEAWPGALLRPFLHASALSLFARLTSHGPARILGIDRGASYSVFSMEADSVSEPRFSKAKVSPYFNMSALRCLAAVIRGKVAYYGGSPLVTGGFGVNLFENRR